MDFERSLFRLYTRVLRAPNIDVFCKIIGLSSFALGCISLAFLLVFHSRYVGNNSLFSGALSYSVFQGETVDIDFSSGKYTLGNTTIYPEDVYVIKFGELSFKYSSTHESISLPEKILNRKEFKIHSVSFSRESLLPDYLWVPAILYDEVNTVLINQLVYTFPGLDGCLLNQGSREIWEWSATDYSKYNEPVLFARILNLCKSVGLFLLMSCMTGLICRLAILGSSAVVVSVYSCASLFRANEHLRQILYSSFP